MSEGEHMIALMIIPGFLRRFIRLPGKRIRFISLVKVVLMFIDQFFPGYKVISSGLFRVIRDSELEIDEKAEGPGAHLFFMMNPSLSGRGSSLHPRKIKGQRKRISVG